ncbi:MAG: hypothetical protein K1X74_06560 [Pirellulales bacterium]|nr:hypothetical protein [Pirellulales bacterium]
MDPLRLALAFGPLAVYLIAVGLLNLSRKPWVVSGGRESCALAIALAGMLTVGPIELFLPRAAATVYGAKAWAMIAGLYFLGATLLILLQRPRLTIYNCPTAIVRQAVGDVTRQLDGCATTVGDTYVLPNRQVQFHLDSVPVVRNTSLVSIGEHQSLDGWKALEARLADVLTPRSVTPNVSGTALVAVGVAILVLIGQRWVDGAVEIAKLIEQMLHTAG